MTEITPEIVRMVREIADDGTQRWFWLGVSGGSDGLSDWPARWVGPEIVR